MPRLGGYPFGSFLAAATFIACAIAYEARRAPKRKLRHIHTDKAASPGVGHYSQAIVHGDRMYVSGLLPITPAGEKLGNRPFAEQVRQVFSNLKAILEEAGADTDSLLSVRVYITDIDYWAEFNALFASFMGAHKPARCVVPVPVLHYGTALELEAVAAI